MGTRHVVWVPEAERWGSLPSDGVLGLRDLPGAVARIGLRPGYPVFSRWQVPVTRTTTLPRLGPVSTMWWACVHTDDVTCR